MGSHGALTTMPAGSILIDHTTASRQAALDIKAAAAAKGVGFIDAPVSGGQVGAETAALTIMCGASETNFERAAPILSCLGKSVT